MPACCSEEESLQRRAERLQKTLASSHVTEICWMGNYRLTLIRRQKLITFCKGLVVHKRKLLGFCLSFLSTLFWNVNPHLEPKHLRKDRFGLLLYNNRYGMSLTAELQTLLAKNVAGRGASPPNTRLSLGSARRESLIVWIQPRVFRQPRFQKLRTDWFSGGGFLFH